MSTIFHYRLRAPKGLEKTLIKELKGILPHGKTQLEIDSIHKLPGRKIIEVNGNQEMMWKLMSRSRIAEDIQVRPCISFVARGEKELELNLQKVPWHCYLPIDNYHQFKMPQTGAKSFKSKLYHTQKIRDILLGYLNELPVKKAYNVSQKLKQDGVSYKRFKKEWIAKTEEQGKGKFQEKEEHEGQEEGRGRKIKGIDQIKKEMREKADARNNLKQLSKIMVNIVKDRAEVLISPSHEELFKHGHRPFMRWGLLKETLTAACILESGILNKARYTGKLYMWDPFCGSGSFLIETLMMLLDQPIRRMEAEMPFEQWPIHDRVAYQKFKDNLYEISEQTKNMLRDIDIQIIGSDVSLHAIETATKNIEYAEIDKLYLDRVIPDVKAHKYLGSPLIYSQHWPKADLLFQEQEEERINNQEGGLLLNDNSNNNSLLAPESKKSLMRFNQKERKLFLSLYQGDFQTIGEQLYDQTEGFKDFTILTNIPYGHQSKEKMRQTDTDVQNLYRRFGRFLAKNMGNLEKNTFVVAQANHYGHKLSFEKFSNCGWGKELFFNNGGLNAYLYKLDMSQVSETKTTIEAYKTISES